MSPAPIPTSARIVVVGGGAAGICTAWYLKQAGYRSVTVLEKSPRLGGKCRSLTVRGESFDLGANYITSAYKRVRELAAHVDAEMYTEKPGHVIDVATGEMQSIFREILNRTGVATLAWQSLRFLLIRWKLRKLVSPASPGFTRVEEHPEIQGDFRSWLKRNGLSGLAEMFEIPLTLMGYGELEDIAAVYALTYMQPRTFLNLGLFAINFPLRSWPKRFSRGYGRLFERLAAEVDVVTGAKILSIKREDTITVEYRLLVQELEAESEIRETATFDYLILACPQLPEVLEPFLTLSREEKRLMEQVRYNPFYVTTYVAPGTERVAAVTFSLPVPELGEPFVVTRQYPDNDYISVYTRGGSDGEIDRDYVEKKNVSFLKKIGAEDPEVPPKSSDDWAYFPHVTPEAVDQGFYTDFASLQGENRTYYVGGLLAFELVETIAEHAQNLVETHFQGRSQP